MKSVGMRPALGIGRPTLCAILAVTTLGAVVRAFPVIAAGFPLNDGGLFVEMIAAVRAGGYHLPETVAYNGLQIPFAYPPAGFFVGAAWADLTGMSLINTVRVVPLIFSIFSVPLAFAVYRPLLGTDARAVAATAGFALMARSYNWQITGGGVTRSLGLLLALTAVAACVQMYRRPHAGWWPILTGTAAGLCALSHPQAAVFVGVSMLAMVPFSPIGWRTAALRLIASVGVAAVVLSPWLVTVVGRHGWSTLLGAAQTGGGIQESLILFFTFRFSDGFVEMLGIIGAFGLFVCIVNRQWLFPVWAALVFLVGSRAGLTYATVPVAGAMAYALLDAFRWLRVREPVTTPDLFRPRRAAALIVVLLVAGVADSLASRYDPGSPLEPLSDNSRAAMAWAAAKTADDATFLVAAGEPWQLDAVSEWFPVLAGRRSLATVQGWEWLGPGRFREQERRNQWLLNCAALTENDCAAEWTRVVEAVDYVFVTEGDRAANLGHPCCLQLADRLVDSGGRLAFSQGDVRIVQVAGDAEAAP